MVLFVGFGASVGVGCEGGSDTGDADVIGTRAGARNNGVLVGVGDTCGEIERARGDVIGARGDVIGIRGDVTRTVGREGTPVDGTTGDPPERTLGDVSGCRGGTAGDGSRCRGVRRGLTACRRMLGWYWGFIARLRGPG